jgi:hypothetical protein
LLECDDEAEPLVAVALAELDLGHPVAENVLGSALVLLLVEACNDNVSELELLEHVVAIPLDEFAGMGEVILTVDEAILEDIPELLLVEDCGDDVIGELELLEVTLLEIVELVELEG